mgnify:FL=1
MPLNNPGGWFGRLVLRTPFLAFIFAFLTLGSAGAAETVRVHIPPGESPPKGWTVKEWRGKADIGVVKTQFGNAIHMKSAGTSSAVYKEVSFDLKEFPHLNWRWMVTKLPKGADVRRRSADDQAIQVYVVFPRWPEQVNSRLVGYIWDSSAPEGLTVRSAKSKNTRYVVLKSGAAGVGDWFQEKRNVYEDYRALFNEEPPKAGSVTIMIDSDDTKSVAEAFVSDIYFSK